MPKLLLLLLLICSIFLLYKLNSKLKKRLLSIKNKLSFIISSVNEKSIENTPITELPPFKWNYQENGRDWENFPILKSPINIKTNRTIKIKDKELIKCHYPEDPIEMYGNNNGMAPYFYNIDDLYFFEYNNDFYNLKEMVYHHGSEHTIDSMTFDCEIQFVHLNSKKEILIISVLVDYESNSNEDFYNNFIDIFDDVPSFSKRHLITYKGSIKKFDLHKLFKETLKESKKYVYQGNLTIPCFHNNDVTWIIYDQIIKIPYKLNDIDGLINNCLTPKINSMQPILNYY